jgi:hypothetical protein
MAKAKVEVEEAQDEALGAGPVTAVKSILTRIIAVFAASGLGVIGAGAIIGIDTLSAIVLAGTLGVANVVEKLARAYLDDGKLTVDEINSAFSGVDKRHEG